MINRSSGYMTSPAVHLEGAKLGLDLGPLTPTCSASLMYLNAQRNRQKQRGGKAPKCPNFRVYFFPLFNECQLTALLRYCPQCLASFNVRRLALLPT